MAIKVFQSSFNFSLHSYNSTFDCPSRALPPPENVSDLARPQEQSHVPCPTGPCSSPGLASPESTQFCFHYIIFICPIMKQRRGQVPKGPTLRRTGMTNFQISGKTLLRSSLQPFCNSPAGECKPCCSQKLIMLSVPLIPTGKQNSLIKLFTLCKVPF